jgi:uncharacterized membrane protein YbhN (UPF0104 family)
LSAPGVPGVPRGLVLALRLAVAAALLAHLFGRIDAGAVRDVIGRARAVPVLGAFGATLAAHLVAAVRLRLLARAQGLPATILELFALNLAAVFYGLFLPGGNLAGTVVRTWTLARGTGRYAATGVTVLVDRIAATVPLCVLGLLFWVVDAPPGAGAALALLLAATAGVAVLSLALLGGRLGSLATRLAGLRRFPDAGRPTGGAARALTTLRGLPARTAALVAGLSTAATVLGIVGTWWLALALGIAVPFAALAWIRSAVMLLAMLPVTISGLGVREGAAVALLGPYGVSAEHALALALLMFGVTVVAVGIVGAVIEAARPPGRGRPEESRGREPGG